MLYTVTCLVCFSENNMFLLKILTCFVCTRPFSDFFVTVTSTTYPDQVFINNDLKERDDFVINGGKKLKGTITTNTSKNGAMGLMHAALLNRGVSTLHGIPRIQEVFRIIEIFESLDVDIHWIEGKNTLIIKPPKKINFDKLHKESASLVRSFIMAIGPLLHHLHEFEIPTAGGCKMGERTLSAHKHGIEQFGVAITTKSNGYFVKRKQILKPADIVMYEASDTATENIIVAAAGIAGKTIIHFAQQNYMVLDVCFYLQKLGVRIEGIGSTKLVIHGKENINRNIEHYNSEDPVESMMLISAAIVTNSNLVIKRCPFDFLKLEIIKLEKMGVKLKCSESYLSYNKNTILVDITVRDSSKLVALPEKIHAQPNPGINTDNLPFFVPVALNAKGTTLVHDWMWENRAIYSTEIRHFGASIRLADPHRVFIEGGRKLSPAEIICPPALRPSAMLMIVMLGIKGKSTLRNVYSIKRGYENIVERLNAVGADIKMNTRI